MHNRSQILFHIHFHSTVTNLFLLVWLWLIYSLQFQWPFLKIRKLTADPDCTCAASKGTSGGNRAEWSEERHRHLENGVGRWRALPNLWLFLKILCRSNNFFNAFLCCMLKVVMEYECVGIDGCCQLDR